MVAVYLLVPLQSMTMAVCALYMPGMYTNNLISPDFFFFFNEAFSVLLPFFKVLPATVFRILERKVH